MASGNDPEKAIANITKGPDKKEELMLIMDAHNKWDHLILPAPMSICLLGQLLMVSAERDISLRDREPEGGFKYLKYPDSFRACLVQISNGGWDAFNQAHSSMDQIRLHTAGVEIHVRNALKILLGGTLSEIDLVVPMSLEKVSEIAEQCKLLAERTEDKFVEVMQLCNEVQEACMAAKGYYEESARKTERNIERASLEKERSEEWTKKFEAELEKKDKEVEKAQNQFEKYMSELPSTGTIILTHLAQGLINTATAPFSIFSMLKLVNEEATEGKGKKAETDKYVNANAGDMDALGVIPHIKEIEKFFKSDGGLNAKDLAERIAQETLKILKSDQERFTENGGKIKKIIDQAVALCEEVINYTENMEKDPKREEKMFERFKALKKAACTLEAHINKNISNLLSSKSSVCQEKSRKGTSLSEDVTENARFKTEMAKANLEQAQKSRDKMYTLHRQENEKLHKALVELKTLDIAKIDFEEIQRILREGLAALGEVRKQWEKLCQFFQMLSNLIKITLNRSLTSFVDSAKGGAKLRLKSNFMSEIYKDILINHATEANRIAFVVQNISTAYVEISAKHLMPGITSLGGLLHLDPVKDGREMGI